MLPGRVRSTTDALTDGRSRQRGVVHRVHAVGEIDTPAFPGPIPHLGCSEANETFDAAPCSPRSRPPRRLGHAGESR